MVGASIDASGFLLAAGGLLTTSNPGSLIVPASLFVHYRVLHSLHSIFKDRSDRKG
jgi:hypothetical protein